MICLKPLNSRGFEYSFVIGTGGIGSGMFFKLEGNHTLGRNESRSGVMVPCKDYCKQHIILHYVSVLLGADPEGSFNVFPIGKVGNDVPGKQLLEEMKQAGMTMKGVSVLNEVSTLFSVCFQYPDSTGGNITTSDSASNKVIIEDVELFFRNFNKTGKGIVLAAPEVSLTARLALLDEGRKRGFFNAAALLSSEAEQFGSNDGFSKVDLIALNIDEAGAIAGIADEAADSRVVAEACIKKISDINPSVMISITDGPNGSYGYMDRHIEYIPSLKTKPVGTGGAGDAFLSGTLAGLCCGLPFLKGRNDSFYSETPIESALELGTLLASLTVTSPDTIHQTANAELLMAYAAEKGVVFSDGFKTLFGNLN